MNRVPVSLFYVLIFKSSVEVRDVASRRSSGILGLLHLKEKVFRLMTRIWDQAM